jgi:hypothetical protein
MAALGRTNELLVGRVVTEPRIPQNRPRHPSHQRLSSPVQFSVSHPQAIVGNPGFQPRTGIPAVVTLEMQHAHLGATTTPPAGKCQHAGFESGYAQHGSETSHGPHCPQRCGPMRAPIRFYPYETQPRARFLVVILSSLSLAGCSKFQTWFSSFFSPGDQTSPH